MIVGSLELLISTRGADTALRDIERVDRAAATSGARLDTMGTAGARGLRALGDESARALAGINRLAGGNLNAISRRVDLLGDGLRIVSTRAGSLSALAHTETTLRSALASGNITLERRIALERQLATTQATRAAGSLRNIVRERISGAMGAAGGLFGGLGVTLGAAGIVAGVASTLTGAVDASNRFATSLRVLDSTSRVTGVPLTLLQRTSADLSRSLGLTATTANTMTATAVRFTAAAGRANDTGLFMTRWLELAASRGLSAAEAMQALETTMAGQDEGLNRLGLRNPSLIYKQWGAGADEASQKGAIVNEVLSVGASVAGAYAERMATAQGATERLTNAKQNFLVALGLAITGGEGYTGTLGTLTVMVDRMTAGVERSGPAIRNFVRDLGSIVSTGAGVLRFLSDVGVELDLLNARLQVASSWARVGLMFGQGDSQRDLERARAARDAALAARDANYLNRGGPGASVAADNPFASRGSLGDPRGFGGISAFSTRTPFQFGGASPFVGGAGGGGRTGTGGTGTGRTGAVPFPTLLSGGPAGIASTMTRGALAPMLAPVQMPIRIRPLVVNLPEAARELRARTATFANSVGHTIAGSISSGFGAAFTRVFQGGSVLSSIGAGFKAMGANMLGGLGSALVAFGEKALIAGTLMQVIKTAMEALLPGGAIVSSIAMIALGTGLQAAAGSMFSGGKGGGGGGSFSAPAVGGGDQFGRVVLAPRAAPVAGQLAPTGRTGEPKTQAPIIQNFTVLGDTPEVQRFISRVTVSAARRGMAVGGTG